MTPSPMIIVVMRVAGAGKTTIGTMLAHALECGYLEGDSLHPPENIEAMTRGVALSDAVTFRHRAGRVRARRAHRDRRTAWRAASVDPNTALRSE